jgi:hypothetical protein
MFFPMISGGLAAYAQCVVQVLDRLVHSRQPRWMLAYAEMIIRAPIAALGARCLAAAPRNGDAAKIRAIDPSQSGVSPGRALTSRPANA